MSLYKQDKTQIAESCFDYLFMEMVHFFNDIENNNEKEKELKNIKLEQMGYVTGQSLAERCELYIYIYIYKYLFLPFIFIFFFFLYHIFILYM